VGLVWIVGLCNAYNFMDGIDGIAAAQAIVAGAGWAWLGWRGGDAMTALAGALIAGASLGFLFFNWPPAKVFMGDAGAAFLGFTFAALTVLALTQSLERAAAGALFVWPFLFDTTFTLVRRLVRGENVLRAHRSHLYQRLVARGWSHARVTMLYAALAALGVAIAG
jgi:UDP-N-acetylmuramyl pentapeptide phosphotransferase/UDP-N-acetylglucosamine-1-phosphate transferase